MKERYADFLPASAGTLAICNVGTMISGSVEAPLIDADTLLVANGRISGIGRQADFELDHVDAVIDAGGCTLLPVLIDNHVHPAFGEWAPRTGQLGWISDCVHRGVTTMISAGEVHVPGFPADTVATKALAIAVKASFADYRPGGMRVLAGATLLTRDMTPANFSELAAAGVTLLGEVGLGEVDRPECAARLVRWARAAGLQSISHTG